MGLFSRFKQGLMESAAAQDNQRMGAAFRAMMVVRDDWRTSGLHESVLVTSAIRAAFAELKLDPPDDHKDAVFIALVVHNFASLKSQEMALLVSLYQVLGTRDVSKATLADVIVKSGYYQSTESAAEKPSGEEQVIRPPDEFFAARMISEHGYQVTGGMGTDSLLLDSCGRKTAFATRRLQDGQWAVRETAGGVDGLLKAFTGRQPVAPSPCVGFVQLLGIHEKES